MLCLHDHSLVCYWNAVPWYNLRDEAEKHVLEDNRGRNLTTEWKKDSNS
jgi:hypothetical protein